jgi:hypothetical protein
MDRVFLSYRRSDAGIFATELQERLADELDAEVFMDLRSILPGRKWEAEIRAALQRCSVIVILLSRDWAGARADGARRIDDEDDVFQLEAEQAV